MSKRDYYEILEVSRNASEEDIKKSYRKLAMKFHPDRVAHMADSEKKQAEEKFKELQEAYAVVSDPQKKQMYDQFGHAGVGGNSASGQGGFTASGFEDIFETFGDIFGGGRRGGQSSRSQQMRGGNLESSIEVTLEESAFGVTRQITYSRTEKCNECNGSGASKNSEIITCKTCKGQGQVRFAQGFFSVQQTCHDCHGAGKVTKNPCVHCNGIGLIKDKRQINVTIPSGIDDGSTLRLTGEGDAGLNGGPNGDLYVHVSIKPHKVFKRQGKDLHCEVPISFVVATLGDEVEVPTLDGKVVKLKIPEGTQTNSALRIREKGVKSLRGVGHGDMYCHIVVETPIKLTEAQKNLLRQFNSEISGDKAARHQPKSKSFIDRLKDMFTPE